MTDDVGGEMLWSSILVGAGAASVNWTVLSGDREVYYNIK